MSEFTEASGITYIKARSHEHVFGLASRMDKFMCFLPDSKAQKVKLDVEEFNVLIEGGKTSAAKKFDDPIHNEKPVFSLVQLSNESPVPTTFPDDGTGSIIKRMAEYKFRALLNPDSKQHDKILDTVSRIFSYAHHHDYRFKYCVCMRKELGGIFVVIMQELSHRLKFFGYSTDLPTQRIKYFEDGWNAMRERCLAVSTHHSTDNVKIIISANYIDTFIA